MLGRCASSQEIVNRFQALFERSYSHLQAAYATFEAKEVFIIFGDSKRAQTSQPGVGTTVLIGVAFFLSTARTSLMR